MMKTQTIRGQAITLEAGRHYRAGAPIGTTTVDITDLITGAVVHTFDAGTITERDRFLKRFNNGQISHTGRCW